MGRKRPDGGEGLHSKGKLPNKAPFVKTENGTKSAPTNRPWQAQGLRLKVIRREKGIDQATLATKLGVNRSTVSDWERGVQVPRSSHLQRMAGILEVPLSALKTAGMLAAKTTMKEREIPVLGEVAAGEQDAGVLTLIRERPEDVIAIPEGVMALRVRGDSMTPVALNGQWVICDTVDPIVHDLVVCELPGNTAIFRRLGIVTKAGTYVLEAVNPSHGPSMEVDPKEIVACYRVIGVCFIAD